MNIMSAGIHLSKGPLGVDRWSSFFMLTLYIPTQTREEDWPYAVTRMTAHFMCGLMSDLVICKCRQKMYGHTWHWMSLLRPGVIRQHKPNQTLSKRLYSKVAEMCFVNPVASLCDFTVHKIVLAYLLGTLCFQKHIHRGGRSARGYRV